MGRPIKRGSTDQSVVIHIMDSTTGADENAVDYNTAGIDLWYRRQGATKTVITEATLAALDSAHSDGGIEFIADGDYRLDLPDAAVASAAGVNEVTVGGTVTGMLVVSDTFPLVAYDPYDVVRMGITALPNAAADAAGGLPISDAGGLDLDAKLAATNEVTAARMGALTDWINGGRLDLILDIIAADTTTDIPALIDALPTAAEIKTAMEAAGGHLALILDDTGTAGVVLPQAQADKVWGTAARVLTANTNLNDPTAAAVADAVWDEVATGHTDAGKAGAQVWTDIDAIAVDVAGLDGAAMRGTDSAALASVCTEARLSELDAATAGKVANQVDIIQTDTTTDIPALIGTPAGASVSADIAAIEAQTDDIGAAGAGLTAVPWNAAWDAEVQSEVFDALDAAFTDATGLTANGLLDRIRTLGWIERNKLEVTDANGNTVFYKDDSTTAAFTVATALTDDSTTTTRLRIA